MAEKKAKSKPVKEVTAKLSSTYVRCRDCFEVWEGQWKGNCPFCGSNSLIPVTE